MSIQRININNTTFSTKILKNKFLLKSLEKVSDHGTTFSAGTSLVLSVGLRPFAIASTPDVEKENKQYAIANSICSGLIKFGIVEAVALPIENAIKKIDTTPEKYLENKTIKHLLGNASNINKSRAYRLITQILKLSTGFITAIPKSILTLAMIPILMDKTFFKHTKKQDNKNELHTNKNKEIQFTGSISNPIAKKLAKIIDQKPLQDFAIKNQTKDKDISKHITAGTDILLTSSFAYQTMHSKKIKENHKKALIYNNLISTGITLGFGYVIDHVIKNSTGKFIEKFKKINANDPKLHKYIEGINILRPALIFATIYYGILPMFSTYMAEKIDKHIEKL